MRALSVCILLLANTINAITVPFDKIKVIQYVNGFRIKHQAPPLVSATSIDSVAQNWADQLASTGQFIHSSTSYGENLAMIGTGPKTDYTKEIMSSVDMFYDEVAKYDYNNPVYSSGTGHFTQLVWVSSKFIGIGASYTNGRLYVVLNFDPSGNYMGVFATNVLPPIDVTNPIPDVFPYLSPPPPPKPVKLTSPPPRRSPPLPVSSSIKKCRPYLLFLYTVIAIVSLILTICSPLIQ